MARSFHALRAISYLYVLFLVLMALSGQRPGPPGTRAPLVCPLSSRRRSLPPAYRTPCLPLQSQEQEGKQNRRHEGVEGIEVAESEKEEETAETGERGRENGRARAHSLASEMCCGSFPGRCCVPKESDMNLSLPRADLAGWEEAIPSHNYSARAANISGRKTLGAAWPEEHGQMRRWPQREEKARMAAAGGVACREGPSRIANGAGVDPRQRGRNLTPRTVDTPAP